VRSVGIAASAALHGALLPWAFLAGGSETLPVLDPTTDAVELVDPEPAPAARVETGTTRESVVAVSSRDDHTSVASSRIAVERASAGRTDAENGSSRESSGLLDMRRRSIDLDLTLHGHDIDRVEPPSSRPRVEPPPHNTFDIKVAPDGTVRIHDTPSVTAERELPTLAQIGKGIADWYEAPKGTWGETDVAPLANMFRVNAAPGLPTAVMIPLIGGKLDPLERAMRARGEDPYASKKLATLDATRDERAAIGAAHQSQQLARATRLMAENLARVWGTTTDPAARKQAAFELWDECAESGDAETVAAGEAARRLVIEFLHAHQVAFTPAELAAFDRAKHSAQRFAPR
jgi:hypothetical protein